MARMQVGGVHSGLQLNVERLDAPAGERTDGNVPTVVCVHGIGTDSLASYYFTVGPALTAAGCDVVLYDQRGHGRSDRPRSGYTLQHFTADLAALLDELEVRGPVHLVGNSFGGTVAFDYALRYPGRVASLVMVESAPPTAEWAAEMGRLLRRSRDQLQHPMALAWIEANCGGHTSRLAKAAAKMLRETTLADEIPAGDVVTEERIRQLSIPLLAVYGAESDLVAQAPWLESLIPWCRTVSVPGHEHSVLIGTPAEMRDIVIDWVAEQRNGRAPHPCLGEWVRPR